MTIFELGTCIRVAGIRHFSPHPAAGKTDRPTVSQPKGPTELLIVLAIIMLLFGATKLPKLARSLGESAQEFKNAQSAIDSVNEPHDMKA